MIMARAVMMHGAQAGEARFQRRLGGRFPRPIFFGEEMTRMLLAVATPMHMMAPVKAGTLRVVPVRNNIQTMPASAPGKRRDDNERFEPRLEIHDHEQVDENDRETSPACRPENEEFIV